jgi:hypothetical protein
MVMMKIHSKLDDSKISKLNEFFLVADKIPKAERSSRQGFGKFKNKPNPNDGCARLSVLISSGVSPLTNDLLSLATPSVQSSREAPLSQSAFLSENPFGKEEKEFRASEVPAAPNIPARCHVPFWTAQASLERSDGGALERSCQRSPLELTPRDMPD